MRELPLRTILVGDAVERLRELPGDSVDCVVTSPPYFRLRDYQHPGQIGLEREVDQWVSRLVGVARELRRVLVPTGSLWLNLGDSYSLGREGAPRKSLLLGPERLAMALVAEGWILRNKVIWKKSNPMPTSVGDRLASTYEVIYFLTPSPHYFFDLDAVRVPHVSARRPTETEAKAWSVPETWRGPNVGSNSGLDRLRSEGRVGHRLGKNPGDVWSLPTASYSGAHHAVFPIALATRPIQATCPLKRCRRCRAPWRSLGSLAVRGALDPTCDCQEGSEPGVVLDPFMGSGTTAIGAERLDRGWIGIEINSDLASLAEDRIAAERARRGGSQ
jgi:site-specific DNA-methyltransferase (adenine-specific)